MKTINRKALRTMLLLSSGLSYFIKSDSFRCNLNLLLFWSMIADFLVFFTRFAIKLVIQRCSEALTKKCLSDSTIRKQSQSCIRNHLPYCSLRISSQSKNRLTSLFCFKGIIPKEISSHLVYKLCVQLLQRNLLWRVIYVRFS